jgi:hypothetical protein
MLWCFYTPDFHMSCQIPALVTLTAVALETTAMAKTIIVYVK